MIQFSQKAVVADARALSRAGIDVMLTKHCGVTIVGHVESFDELIRRLVEDGPVGLVTLDAALPGLKGLQAIRRLRQTHPETRIAVVSSSRDRQSILDTMMAGAHGHIPEDLSTAHMVEAFHTILQGRLYVPADVTDMRAARLEPASPIRAQGHEVEALTDRQRDVLELLATGKSNKEIGRALLIAESTVKIHVTAAFRRLGVRNRLSAIVQMQRIARQPVCEEPMFQGIERRQSA